MAFMQAAFEQEGTRRGKAGFTVRNLTLGHLQQVFTCVYTLTLDSILVVVIMVIGHCSYGSCNFEQK